MGASKKEIILSYVQKDKNGGNSFVGIRYACRNLKNTNMTKWSFKKSDLLSESCSYKFSIATFKKVSYQNKKPGK
jgi:hypothetical protein